MKRADSDQLLNELFPGDDLATLRRTTLERWLAGARLRRRRRRMRQACALTGLVLAAILGLIFTANLSDRKPRTLAGLPPAAKSPVSEGNESVKMLTDEELFALFPNRPLALIGKPGQQQLVLLDSIRTPETPPRQ